MAKASSEYYIGLMSGTSADGMDAALIEFEDNNIKLINFITQPMPLQLRQDLLDLNQNSKIELESFCQLQKNTAELAVQAVQNLLQKTQFESHQIKALGSHGQTIYHAPSIGMTLQIGHAAIIAKQTGITTVADFRMDDIALGGEGAPFAPAFHQQIFNAEKGCFVVNIGGISNLTYLPDKADNPIIGYDTGPGNALLDEITQTYFNQAFDENGHLAIQGRVNQALLEQLLTHPFFSKDAPKSTGRETFNSGWLTSKIQTLNLSISKTDLLATLTELTAITITVEIKKLATSTEPVWIVGGGALNSFLISRIQAQLLGHSVQSSAVLGVDPNAIEAMLCAWLAKQRLNNCTVNLSSVTGAQRDAVLGAIWHA